MSGLQDLAYRLSTEPELRRRFLAHPQGVAAALGLPPNDETAAILDELVLQLARQEAREADGPDGVPAPAGPGWMGGPPLTSAVLSRGPKGSALRGS